METEKERIKQAKYKKTNDNARSAYARHDGGQGAKNDVPQMMHNRRGGI
jgi:hypothetical protein